MTEAENQLRQIEAVGCRHDNSSPPFYCRSDPKPDNKIFNVNFLSRFDEIYLNSKMLTTAFYDYQKTRESGGDCDVIAGSCGGKATIHKQDTESKAQSSTFVRGLTRNDSDKSLGDEDVRRRNFNVRSFPFDDEISKSQMIRGNAVDFY